MRSHTALRIEKIKQEKTKRSKIKSIKWRENNAKTQPGKECMCCVFPVRIDYAMQNFGNFSWKKRTSSI